MKQIKCQRCGEILNEKTAKLLEYSLTDGNYYADIPKNHESQGSFYFGIKCAINELKDSRENIENKSTEL